LNRDVNRQWVQRWPAPWAALVCAVFVGASAAFAAASARPNVVVILSDDQGWGDVSFNGNTNLHTPNLDSLARQGAVFDRFLVSPVCSPTRAELLTGRYHPRGGVRGVSTGKERLDPDERTIAEAFRAAGYRTGLFGKWHNGSQWPYHPNARGFEEFYGFTSGHWGEYFDPPLEHNGRFVRGRGYIADDLTDHALGFMEANRARPFFCYLAFNTPHSPFCVPDDFWNRFKDKPITQLGPDGDRENLPVTRAALAMCENLDWNVGRILRRLEALGLADNTIVVFFSDNGPASRRWNGGMKGIKGSVDEGGVRVPCFIRWPGRIKPGTLVREIAGAMDLLPTLTALAGVPFHPPKPLDGVDVSPLLLGTAHSWPERLLFAHHQGRVSARSPRYRLDERGALFDMIADPGQTRDIAAEKPDVARQLARAVAQWRAEVLTEAPDERPFPVGFAEFPMTPLPARDAVPRGNIQRSAPAPNCSWFKNWTSTNDAITWDVEVHTNGDYEATVFYTCPEADAGSTVELSFKGSRVTGRVWPAWDPPLKTNEDRVPRRAESYMKEFRPLQLGRLRLEKGRGELRLRALSVPGRQVMDFRMLTLTLVKPD
jgi:arylsulfatase A-like enzyme